MFKHVNDDGILSAGFMGAVFENFCCLPKHIFFLLQEYALLAPNSNGILIKHLVCRSDRFGTLVF